MCRSHALPVHPSSYSAATGGTGHHCIIYNLAFRCMSLHYSSGAWQPDKALCHARCARKRRRILLLSFKTLLSADSKRGVGGWQERTQASMCRAITGACGLKACALGEKQRGNLSFYAFLTWSHSWFDASALRGESSSTPSALTPPVSQTYSVWSLTLQVQPDTPFSAAFATLTQRPSTCTDSLPRAPTLSLHPGLLFRLVICVSMLGFLCVCGLFQTELVPMRVTRIVFGV